MKYVLKSDESSRIKELLKRQQKGSGIEWILMCCYKRWWRLAMTEMKCSCSYVRIYERVFLWTYTHVY